VPAEAALGSVVPTGGVGEVDTLTAPELGVCAQPGQIGRCPTGAHPMIRAVMPKELGLLRDDWG
jgi:hypothetical protein